MCDSTGIPQIIHFKKGNLSVKEAADALGFDKQTVRTLIQTGSVGWGQAIKKPGSGQFMYIISPKNLAAEILLQKIDACNKEIKSLPDFLADDLLMERGSYERQLARLQGGGDT